MPQKCKKNIGHAQQLCVALICTRIFNLFHLILSMFVILLATPVYQSSGEQIILQDNLFAIHTVGCWLKRTGTGLKMVHLHIGSLVRENGPVT